MSLQRHPAPCSTHGTRGLGRVRKWIHPHRLWEELMLLPRSSMAPHFLLKPRDGPNSPTKIWTSWRPKKFCKIWKDALVRKQGVTRKRDPDTKTHRARENRTLVIATTLHSLGTNETWDISASSLQTPIPHNLLTTRPFLFCSLREGRTLKQQPNPNPTFPQRQLSET